MIDNAIETNCDALRTMFILPQPANCLRLNALVSEQATPLPVPYWQPFPPGFTG